ncbi:hypothetical protein AAC387_Pa07g1874 [Persea americana]
MGLFVYRCDGEKPDSPFLACVFLRRSTARIYLSRSSSDVYEYDDVSPSGPTYMNVCKVKGRLISHGDHYVKAAPFEIRFQGQTPLFPLMFSHKANDYV